MAYRKTEKVLAHLEARRAGIIAAAIDVIAKSGMEGLTTDAIAERGAIAVGLIYKYFPDKTELLAAVVAQLLARDLAAVKECGTLSDAIPVFFNRICSNYRLMSAIGQVPAYREGIRREFARLIRATGTESPTILAAAVYGAIFEAAGIGPRVEQSLTICLLRAIGVHAYKKVGDVA